MSIDLFIVSILRAVVEIALLALVGRGALALLAGARRQGNPIYQLFVLVTRPAIGLTRRLVPRAVIDRHLPFVAFFLLFWLWIFLAWLKRLLAAL